MNDLFELESHTVLRASAGTGKTEALTNQYLRLITGATSFDRPIPPRRIVAVTFTEKAAAEMRSRIHRALLELKSDVPDAQALHSVRQLRTILRERNIALTPEAIAELLRSLATARIMTIHALCLSLLQDHASHAGVDPQFTVLDDERSTVLLEQTIEEVVLSWLESENPNIPKLLDETGGFYPWLGRGIVPMLKQLYLACKESGDAIATILEKSAFGDSNYPRLQLQVYQRLGLESGQDLATVWPRLLQMHRACCEATPGVRQHKPSIQRLFQCIAQLEAQYPSGARTIDELANAEWLLQEACGTGKLVDQEPAADLRAAIRELWALPRAKEYAVSISEMLKAVDSRYSHIKHSDGLLDYQDLTLGARQLLTEHPDIQRQIADGIDVLLVDEFQDTNAAQRDIVQCIIGSLTASPAGSRLFIVGDRKQSIYGFRGADVLVFEHFVHSLQQQGAQTTALQTSYRSSPQLLSGLNLLSSAALQPSSEDPSDLEFSATDALYPPTVADASAMAGMTAAVELLGDPDQLIDPDTEAHWIASRAAELVNSSEEIIRDNGKFRPARFADMALLLPRFTHVQVYLGALQELGVPFTVIRSKGLMAGAEARDILSICKVLLNRFEAFDLLAVLRSPCCTCSDQTLVAIASCLRNATDPLQRLATIDLAFLDADEQRRYERCRDMLIRLQGSVEALGLGRTLKLLLTHCQYTAVLAGLPSAHQRLSNVDRILEEITSREHRGDSSSQILRDFFRRQRLGTGDYETAVALEDADVLSVMTIHQAKGLEFPVIFAADLGRKLPSSWGLATYDAEPGAGLSMAVRGLNGKMTSDPHSQRLRDKLKARQAAESKRLFYVQITRARDRLILSGKNQGLLRALLQTAIPELGARGLLVRSAPADSRGAPAALSPPSYLCQGSDGLARIQSGCRDVQ
jgi:ATP-dependent helicase/nuclease subunit A